MHLLPLYKKTLNDIETLKGGLSSVKSMTPAQVLIQEDVSVHVTEIRCCYTDRKRTRFNITTAMKRHNLF